MDYHAEVEIHEGDDGGIVLDIHAKKNRGTLFVCRSRFKGASTYRKVALLEKFRLCITEVFINVPLFFII